MSEPAAKRGCQDHGWNIGARSAAIKGRAESGHGAQSRMVCAPAPSSEDDVEDEARTLHLCDVVHAREIHSDIVVAPSEVL